MTVGCIEWRMEASEAKQRQKDCIKCPWWVARSGDRASQVTIVVKKRPANGGDLKDTWVRPLGQEDPLEKSMATH